MNEFSLTAPKGLTRQQKAEAVDRLLDQYSDLHKVLIVPPDYTRCYSCAGELTQLLYRRLTERGVTVHVIPALGTHMPLSEAERQAFFGDVVPPQAILCHHWQSDTVRLGVVPHTYVAELSEGLYDTDIEVEVNHLLVDGGYDLILSVGQVVPHEVVGMANYSKNLFVGLGGRSMINKSHMLSAICGIERALGVTDTPARLLYDYAQRNFIDGRIPVVFLLTVTTQTGAGTQLDGLFVGESRRPFEQAAALSQQVNITYLDHRAKKVVTYLDPEELKTTWVGNKGVYRTRMAIADGGELLILAPGVAAFGENAEMDAMTRRYGYCGRDAILDLYRQGAFTGRDMSAAHLIQGSTDGRFTVTYATCPEKLSRQEIESVCYQWQDYYEAARRYDPHTLSDGWHVLDGEEFYFIGKPATGLWKCAE